MSSAAAPAPAPPQPQREETRTEQPETARLGDHQQRTGCRAVCDKNADGLVNNADLLALQQALGSVCEPPPAPAIPHFVPEPGALLQLLACLAALGLLGRRRAAA